MNRNNHTRCRPASHGWWGVSVLLVMRCLPLLLGLLMVAPTGMTPAFARSFGAYVVDVAPSEVFPGADRFGDPQGKDAVRAAYRGNDLLGYVFVSESIGYSGKPIRILGGMTVDGVITGAKVMEHHEPILLVGIPQEKLFDFVSAYVGRNLIEVAKGSSDTGQVDAISGATVTAIVINDGLMRSALSLARTYGLAGFTAGATAPVSKSVLAEVPYAATDWATLLGDGSVRRLSLLNADVDAAFARIGVGSGEPYMTPGKPDAEFIDLYVAQVSVETIGRTLLGDEGYRALTAKLKPGQAAVLIAANGEYSFRGSGYVRGGIFDRFQLIQDETSILFTDKVYSRLGDVRGGAPSFQEVGLFRVPETSAFDPARPWRIDLLATRPTSPLEKAFTTFSLEYSLPGRFVRTEVPAGGASAASSGASSDVDSLTLPASNRLWVGIWTGRVVDIVILSLSLALLTLIFFFQDWLVKRPKLFTRLRTAYLVFSVVWIGGYAQAQLSVVNVLTFVNALLSGFRWDFFLLEPLIFILWCATAVSLLFWGRGPFCGWLCPFGSLQELLNKVARRLGIRQITIRFSWHERLWPLKYILFLGLFALSLNEMALAEQFAEVEPFKTVVLLRFLREWPFVLWAVAMLAAGLFIERFYCRYLCPLGAALAIPGRMRLFDWLKRRKQCGFECQTCAKDCPVQSIHPLGQINPNECIYCMNCQVIHWDDTRCMPLILKKTGRGKKAAPALSTTAAPAVAPSVQAPVSRESAPGSATGPEAGA